MQTIVCQIQGDSAELAYDLGRFPVIIGRSGARLDKREGDGATPLGRFALRGCFGIKEPPPGLKMPYRRVLPSTVCVDDPTSSQYNTITDSVGDWKSAEQMHAYEQYAYGIIIDAPVGSCLFMHVKAASQTSTAGCIAMDEKQLLEIMLWLDPDQNPHLTTTLPVLGADDQGHECHKAHNKQNASWHHLEC